MPTKDFTQRFSGGADGDLVTQAKTAAGGDPLDFLIKNGGTDILAAGDATFKFRAASAIEGTIGARWDLTGITGNTYGGWLIPTGYGRHVIARQPIWLTALPLSASQLISRIDTPTSSSQVKINTAGKLTISTTAAGDIVASTSTNAIPTLTKCWLEHEFIAGTTTSNGTVGYRIVTTSNATGSGTDTVLAGLSYSSNVQNTGTDTDVGGATSRIRFQAPLAASGLGTWDTDLWRMRVTDDLTSWLGPYSPTLPPTLVVSQPAPNLVDLRGSAVGDGSTLTFPTPTRLSGPTLTVASLTPGLWMFSQDTSGSAVYSVSVGQGDTRTASSNVTIAAAVTATAPAVQLLTWTGTALV